MSSLDPPTETPPASKQPKRKAPAALRHCIYCIAMSACTAHNTPVSLANAVLTTHTGNKFFQQELPAWKPLLTPGWVRHQPRPPPLAATGSAKLL